MLIQHDGRGKDSHLINRDAPPGFRCTLAVLREVRAMEGNRPRFPPSLNAVKSEYNIFCDRYGGPIICDDRFAKVDFEYCCREFPRRKFQPTIERWARDETHGIRHWP